MAPRLFILEDFSMIYALIKVPRAYQYPGFLVSYLIEIQFFVSFFTIFIRNKGLFLQNSKKPSSDNAT